MIFRFFLDVSIICSLGEEPVKLSTEAPRQRFWLTFTFLLETISGLIIKDVRDSSAIMVSEVKFGAKILPAYSPLNIKVEYQLQSGENASLDVIE